MKNYRLLISGCGDLGTRVLRKLLQSERLEKLEASSIMCETLSPKRHEHFLERGLAVKTIEDEKILADHLLICFPPSEKYVEHTQRALDQWNQKGTAVFVSSTGVYDENKGAFVDEESRLDQDSLLFKAEEIVRKKGAHVLRLAGLYNTYSGAHMYWQKKGSSKSPEGYINLIHRQDAADACSLLLASSQTAQTWNLSDGVPLKRKEIAHAWGQVSGAEKIQFHSNSTEIDGKKVKPDKFFRSFEWTPRWKGFQDYIQSLMEARNVLGSELKSCCQDPVTGFARDGYCKDFPNDPGKHLCCVEVTEDFLSFSKAQGNDLSTPRPEFSFRGLKAGDKWCLCASRWVEAWYAGCAPRIYLESTHEQMLNFIEIEVLKKYALDLS